MNQTLPEQQESTMRGNFPDISQPEEHLHVYSDISQSCDLNHQQLSIGSRVGDTSDDDDDEAEDETDDAVEDETDDAVEDHETNSVHLQFPRIDGRNTDLMRPRLTWEQTVVKVLNMIRRRELYEYNHKLHTTVPTRLCRFNIALFDFDKECEFLQLTYRLAFQYSVSY